MNPFRRIPVTLVLVDSGPLISLAACGKLSLLNSFNRKVRIVDVVKGECLRYPDKIGFKELQQWFQELDGDRFAIEPTPLMDDWLEAVKQEAAGDTTRPSLQIGDAAIALATTRFSNPTRKQEVILLLLEDSAFGDGVIRQQYPEVYALSTRSFLTTLQNFGVIQSATAIIHEIAIAGRNVAPYRVDRPGRIGPGTKSQWSDSLQDGSEGSKFGR